MESDQASKVTIYCYDLSGGLASQLSMSLIGKQMDGVWHTGICVYGKEYFYGNGICGENQGQTPFGTPTKIVELGETELPVDVFHDFLQDISERFTFMTYNIATNNCNHFTNEGANFLVDKNIPDFALKQAEEFFETPLGQSLKPLVMAQQNALIQGSSSMFNTGSELQANQAPMTELNSKINIVKDAGLLQENILTTPTLVLYIWSPATPAGNESNAKINELADQYSDKGVNFGGVNTMEVPEVALNFNIQTIPFVYIYNNSDVSLAVEQFDTERIEAELKKLLNIEDQ